ncbi:uncharacterized protein [Typha latifolia]|uniref:uncharacterized protein n=1 Tax=Typha latifolia TaxID=4733 RepID=UPI003C2BCA89
MRRAAPATLRSLRLAAAEERSLNLHHGGAHPLLLSSLFTTFLDPSPNPSINTSSSLSPFSSFQLFSTTTRSPTHARPKREQKSESEGEEWMVEWEEEDEDKEPVIGDGGDGGGVVLGDVRWGERALSVAREVLGEHFGDDMALYAFKVSSKGYVYVRLDKLANEYGCPAIEEMESFSNLYKQRLDEIVERGEIPLDLALEVSSPGAERLLKVPEDLDRFKDLPMRVQYLEEDPSSKQHQLKDGVLVLESTDTETGHCVWKIADVRENRAAAGKGRPLSRKQKDWRLQVPFEAIKRVMLYLESKY